MLLDHRSIRIFFRREVDELSEHVETFDPAWKLAVLHAFRRALDSDEVDVKEVFWFTADRFQGTIELIPPTVEHVDVGYGRSEELVIEGIALLRLRRFRGLRAAMGVDHNPERGTVTLSIWVDRRRAAFLPEIAGWFHELIHRHNPLVGQTLALTEGGGLEFLPAQEVTRDHVILPEELLDGLERDLGFLEDPEAYPRHLRNRSVILAGEPGLGKTLLCRWLSARFPVTTLWVTPGAVRSVGPAGILGTARQMQPALVILEDLDLAAGDRTEGPLGDLLAQLDGFAGMEGVAVLATTNRPEVLDEALDPRTRPGRFHRLILLEKPDADLRRRLLERLVNASARLRPVGEALVERLVAAGDGMSPAQLCQLVADLDLEIIDAARRGRGPVEPMDLVDRLADLRRNRTTFGFSTEAA